MDLKRLSIKDDANPGALSRKALCGVAGLVGLVLGLIIGFGLSSLRTGKAITVETTIVGAETGKAAKLFTAGGWVEAATPQYPIILSSRIPQRLDRLLVSQGDSVQPGQEVARLYDGDATAALALAQARHAEVEEKFRIAEANYTRSQKLKAGILSREQLDQELAAVNQADKARAASEAALELARKQLGYCRIQVPEKVPALRVLDVLHQPGDWIAPNRDAAVVALYDPRDMHMRVDVPQTGIRSVSVGQSVSIRTEVQPKKAYTGTVVRIDPLAELAKNTITVRIKINEPDDQLFPDMVAHASFLAEPKKQADARRGVTVPSAALLGSESDRYVYVYQSGRAARRDVTVSGITGEKAVISEGLTSGQRVITSNLDELSDGQKVERN